MILVGWRFGSTSLGPREPTTDIGADVQGDDQSLKPQVHKPVSASSGSRKPTTDFGFEIQGSGGMWGRHGATLAAAVAVAAAMPAAVAAAAAVALVSFHPADKGLHHTVPVLV